MIALICLGLYAVVGWRAAVRTYLHIEAEDRQWRRNLCAKYPDLYPTQTSRDQAEEEWVNRMAGLNRLMAAMAGIFWPFFITSLVVRHVSVEREKVKS